MLTGIIICVLGLASPQSEEAFTINDREYFDSRGANVLVFSSRYDGLFSDAKMGGVELIHHGVRTATNGDVRLHPTPEQWDAAPMLVERIVDSSRRRIEVRLRYPAFDFSYTLRVESEGDGVVMGVILDRPLPEGLQGRAGLNLEFLPAAYFKKSYVADDRPGIFPIYPGGPMRLESTGSAEPLPIDSCAELVLSPEDPATRVTIRSSTGQLALFDGRNKAQNGWFVVRSLLPANRSGLAVQWHISPNRIAGWTRPPVVLHSQVGYHPDERKRALIELDPNDQTSRDIRLMRVERNGDVVEVLRGEPKEWGMYLRYRYRHFDFTSIDRTGLYILEYGATRSRPFPVSPDVYKNIWQPTLDVFFPVQMDHMFVTEAYRVWHGASHLDDALQAPVNHEHFDLYAQGPATDTRFKPGEHIPGLNVGGWFDAGDFDIRTQTQFATVLRLVHTWEAFKPERDETTIDQERRYVELHRPDGRPDLLQQIEHGVIQLLAQHRAVGHAIPGIVEAHLSQYTHLGDAVTKTDNRVFDSSMDTLERDGNRSGTFDDRWAFTNRSSSLNYGSAAALAGASRVLASYDAALAADCLETARSVWAEERSHEPFRFHHGNTTGGPLEDEEIRAAAELLVATGDSVYASRLLELWPHVEKNFARVASAVVQVLPYLGKERATMVRDLAEKFAADLRAIETSNPFGVPISTGGWAGSGWVVGAAITNYGLHKSFPDLVGADFTLRGLSYLFGCHPGSNISFVSGVGMESKMVAYGNNRADYSFIAGGVVPGVLIVPPDFPENKEDWPFLWGENEYVIGLAASYIFLAQAAGDIVKGPDR